MRIRDLDRQGLIDNAADLFGYSEQEFEDMARNDIWSYLDVSQQIKLAEYVALDDDDTAPLEHINHLELGEK